MKMVWIAAQLHAVEDAALAPTAQLVWIVAGVLVGMLPIQHALGSASLGTASLQTRVLISTVMKTVLF